MVELAGIAQLARASAFQAEGRGFESRFPLHLYMVRRISFMRPRSSVVEHFLGKEEVIGSIPIVGSRFVIWVTVNWGFILMLLAWAIGKEIGWEI